jgi:hypothetical protein
MMLKFEAPVIFLNTLTLLPHRAKLLTEHVEARVN